MCVCVRICVQVCVCTAFVEDEVVPLSVRLEVCACVCVRMHAFAWLL